MIEKTLSCLLSSPLFSLWWNSISHSLWKTKTKEWVKSVRDSALKEFCERSFIASDKWNSSLVERCNRYLLRTNKDESALRRLCLRKSHLSMETSLLSWMENFFFVGVADVALSSPLLKSKRFQRRSTILIELELFSSIERENKENLSREQSRLKRSQQLAERRTNFDRLEFNRLRSNKSQHFIRFALDVELSGIGIPDLIYFSISAFEVATREQFT